MAKSLRKRLEEEGKWKQIESTMKTTPKNSNSNNASVKTMVDNVYNKSTENTWDRVLNRANQLMNDAGNVFSNFGLGIKKSGESALYYIEKMTAGRNAEYQNKVWSKDKKEQVNKKIEEQFNTNKSNDELKLVTKNDFKLQEELNVNPLLYKSELLKNYENPILRNIQENIKEDETKIEENIDNTEGKIMRKVAELTPSIGQSVAGMGASVINPGLGIAFWQTSAGGDYVRDAKARGMNDDDALLYGTIMGGMESATEWIGGELTKGVGKAFTKDGVIKGLKALGLDIGENFFEEAIMEPLQETVATMTGGKETADWSDMTKRMLQSGIDGALTSILMGGASAGVGKAVKLVNKYSKGEKVSQQEIKEALEEINSKEELDIERILVNNFGFNSQDLYKNTTVQQNLENKMNNISSELSQNEIKGILPQKPPATIENNGVLNTNQQTIQNEQKISQNQTSQQLQQNSKYSIKIPNSNYKFVKSGHEKVDIFRQDVSQNWNNSKETQKLVSTIETIIKDKDISVRLDDNLIDTNGNIVEGSYKNGVITINPNSTRAFEYIATHELTHAIGTKQMLDMVQRYRQDNQEFNSKVETLLKNYKATELTEEALSDVSAELFGTQEFIANVKNTNPNLFQKIYNEIKYLWHQFRGYKNQNQFIEDLYNKWTQAYNSNTKLNQTNKYMIAGKKAMNNAISQDYQYKVIENSYNKALQMANQKIDNEIIRQETNWFQDKNGDWKFEFSDEDMSIKRLKYIVGKEYTLKDVLKHDTLFLLYPELNDYKISFVNQKPKGSFFNKSIKINSNLLGDKNGIEGTLIHEIQHAIQNIEGFEKGTNTKLSKLAYYKKLGEIEADDTKNRFLQEKNGNFDRNKVAPESSKVNPKHSKMDNYLKNRNLIDKIKDSIYNYIDNKIGMEDNTYEDNLQDEGNPKENKGQYRTLVDGRKSIENDFIENSEKSSFSMQKDNAQYSKENTEWQEYLEENFESEGTRTFAKDVKITEIDTDTNSSQEEKTYNPSRKAQNYEKRQKSVFKINMSNMLGISQFNQNNKTLFDTAIDELRTEYNTEGKISSESKDRIFNKLYDGLIKEDRAYYDENKDIKDLIRNTKLYVSDKIKSDITDFSEFRKNNFGTISISNEDSNVPVDTFYKELNEKRPDLFPDTITNSSEQLQRIAEISKSIRKSERNISAYNDETMFAEYKQWAKNEFETQVSQLIKQFSYIDKYNSSKQAEFEKKNQEYIQPEIDEIKFIYENKAKLMKEVEKQERYLLLTDREKAVVDRLLNDEMDVEEILPGLNKNAILKSYNARQQLQYINNAVKEYKQKVKENLKDIADSLTVNAKNWKDKKTGIQYARETAIRNIRDIMSKEDAQRLNEEIFEPIVHNTSEQTRFMNSYIEKINSLDLDKKLKYEWKTEEGITVKIDEATLGQLLIEKKIDNNYLTKIGADVEKVNKIANTFKTMLNETVDRMDDVYVKFGYAPVEKRKNYFPHFLENKADSFMSKFANALGFKVNPDNLPTDIAGRTETFKPGRAFNRNILKRTTEKTDYNALKALDMYMQGASDIIYHTEDIQKLRALNESIRDRFKDKEITKKIEEIKENPELTDEERVNRINEIKESIKTPLSNFVTWLDEYTNVLANKKSSSDRQMEKDLNRQIYTTMQDIEGKIASNLIGGNLSVAMTNFSPLAQAMGTTDISNVLIGMIQTVQNNIKEMNNNGDNFAAESDFLTSRRGNELAQKQTIKQKVSNTLGIPMELIDNFTSESIVRAKYRENIKNGIEHNEALKNADMYARNLMADRSKGALPTLFNRKNPIAKLVTSFQVEPNNIISNYFKDMPADVETKTELAYHIVKLSIASYAFNAILKSIRGGSDIIPNPIGIVSQLISLAVHNLDDEEENDEKISEVLTNIGSDILGSIPFGTSLATLLTATGIEGLEDTGKFMVSNAVPSIPKISSLFDSEVSNEYKKQVIANELTKPLIYLGLPTGGSQLSKTAKGLYSYSQGGSYTYDKDGNKKLQFPVEQNKTNLIKSTIFGKYSLPKAQKYIESDFDGLNAKETTLYDNSTIEYDTLKEYLDYSKADGRKKQDKINYIQNMNIQTSEKWDLYKYDIISSTEREDGTSQLSDAEYIIENKMATKSEYMKLYSEAEKNEVEFPSTETIKELNEMDLSLQPYMEYKTELKKANAKKKAEYEKQQKSKLPVSEEEAEKSKTLNTSEKISLIQNEKYTDRERELIYANYISKEDETYQCLKLANNNLDINQYLDFRQSSLDGDFDSDRKDDGTKKGKTITNSAKNKYVKYLNNSNFTSFEKLFLYGSKYTMDSLERSAFTKYINKLKITPEERKEIYLELSSQNVVEMKDGSIKWK